MKQTSLEKLAELESQVQGWGVYDNTSEQYAIKQAYINGYNKDRENLYTEEQVKEAIRLAFLHKESSNGAELWNDYLIIQSLKSKQ